MLYTAIPALAVAAAVILFLDDPGTVTGSVLGMDSLLLVTSLATGVALAPFAMLVAFVLRIATVAKRTLAIGPLVLRETDRDRDLDWDQ